MARQNAGTDCSFGSVRRRRTRACGRPLTILTGELQLDKGAKVSPSGAGRGEAPDRARRRLTYRVLSVACGLLAAGVGGGSSEHLLGLETKLSSPIGPNVPAPTPRPNVVP